MRKWDKPNDDPSECIPPNDWLSHFQLLLNNGKEIPSNLLKELEQLEKQPFKPKINTVSERLVQQ